MSQGEYELAFYGKIVEGTSLDKVKGNIAQLFKANEEQVARMFTGNRVVIRNKLDDETALKYIIAMKKRGAICHIEQMGQPGIEVDLATSATEPSPAVSSVPKTESATIPTPPPAPAVEESTTAPQKVEMANPNALPIAGEKVDEILSKKKIIRIELRINLRLSDSRNHKRVSNLFFRHFRRVKCFFLLSYRIKGILNIFILIIRTLCHQNLIF